MRPSCQRLITALPALFVCWSLACGPAGEASAHQPGDEPGGEPGARSDESTAPVLTHEAYVWQRAWTGAVRAAVAEAAPELTGLRVLALEVEPGDTAEERRDVWPAVDGSALAAARRPVTAVVRIGGARPIAELDLQPLWRRIETWRSSGVEVIGVEIDHDCATAALPDYARWLRAWHTPPELRRSITALPTWAESPALATVAAQVDELVIQVHAVRAPELFDSRRARAWLEDFAATVGDRPVRVALPTYRVEVGGEPLVADPADVAAFMDRLRRAPVANVRGVAWFRLPVAGDKSAWPNATLQAVIGARELTPDVRLSLVERGPELYDIVLENRGTTADSWPDVRLAGDLVALDLTAGYVAEFADTRPDRTTRRFVAPRRILRAGDDAIVGWVRGRELTVAIQNH